MICHSQGGEIAFRAATRSPDRVAALVALEPSGLPEALAAPALPVTLVWGDYLDSEAIWTGLSARWRAYEAERAAAGGAVTRLDLSVAFRGASHLPMLDHGADDMLAALIEVALTP